MRPMKGIIAKYRDEFFDFWDWKDISAGPGTSTTPACSSNPPQGAHVDGFPWCNSHYTR